MAAEMFVEMSRPLGRVAASSLHALEPIVWALGSEQRQTDYRALAELLDRSGAMEYLARRLREAAP